MRSLRPQFQDIHGVVREARHADCRLACTRRAIAIRRFRPGWRACRPTSARLARRAASSVHAALRGPPWQTQASTTAMMSASSSRDRALPLGKNNEKGHDLEIVDPREFALHGVCSTRREQARDRALLALSDYRGNGGGQVASGAARMSWPCLVALSNRVQARRRAALGRGKAASGDRGSASPGCREQYLAIVTNMHEICGANG